MGKKINLNLDWRFHLGDEPLGAPQLSPDFMGYNDSGWRVVTLPHDWSVEHPFDRRHASGTGYLPGGTAWYRKHFTLPEDVSGKRVRITFGGVYKHARVYVNSNHVGRNAYGYTTFTFDVSEFVRPGENVIAVRVEHDEVADSRWFTGSGIYRDVSCEISDMRCFADNGIFVTTKEVAEGKAIVSIKYETLGGDGAAFDIYAPNGDAAGSGKALGKSGECEIVVENPALWSVDEPHLYTLRARVISGGEYTDETEVRFGIRTIRFDADTGFYLNGVNMKLKGFCVHHDAGCLGAAVPKAVWERRLRKLKAVGANALRTSHNPPDTHLLDLCDEMGILVQDEAFDEWEGAKNKWWQGHNVYPPKRYGYAEDFPQWHQFDLEAMVKRDRNHPCVIMWSIGNEIDYPNDPYVTPLFNEVLGNNDANKPKEERMYDDRKPDAGRLAVVAKRLVDIVHAIDVSRPVTSALSFPELSTRTGYADVLDASGYNYKEQFYEEDRVRFPGRVIYGSENGHGAKAWRAVKDNDYICGQFLWTGVDFLGECHGWPVRISQAGLLDLAGHEKPLYYQRKAFWTEEPFVKISVEPNKGQKWHGVWGERFVWDGNEGDPMYVSVATNQPEAELFLNGVSLGKKEISLDTECRATWEVPYAAGELKAVAGEAQDALCTTGKAAAIRLLPDKTAFKADGLDVIQVEVELHDAEGCQPGSSRLTAKDEDIRYQIVGDAVILGIENGIPVDLTPYAEKHRATKQGRAIVYLRAGTLPGDVKLHAYTMSGLKADVTFTQE